MGRKRGPAELGADRSETKSSMSKDRHDRDVFVDDGKELRQVGSELLHVLS
jgi:hypothetical protein